MRSDRARLLSYVPSLVGALLLADWAANVPDLRMPVGADDLAAWSLLIVAELRYLGGVWILSGLGPRTPRSATSFLAGLLTIDLSLILAGEASWPRFGETILGKPAPLALDLIALGALLAWQAVAGGTPMPGPSFRRMLGLAVVALASGAMIHESSLGRGPTRGTLVWAGRRSSATLEYLVYLPDGYAWSMRSWPLILFLHGAGSSGTDLDKVRVAGPPRLMERGRGLPFIVVAPQSRGGGWDCEVLRTLLDEVLSKYRVDSDRVYLTGLSMGGYGTWSLAAAYPERFAAIAPICGGGDPALAGRLKGLPAWVFHGAEDRVVPLERSASMVEALRAVSGDVTFTVYPTTGHDSWTVTYNNPDLYAWLLRHKRRPAVRQRPAD